MKVCLNCSSPYRSGLCDCPNCGHRPRRIDGFHAYAPELAHEGGGFKPEYFSQLSRLEASNFWFRARNQLILWAIARYGTGFQSLLEIGCGTGYVLSGIAENFPDVRLQGSEIFVAGLAEAAARLQSVELMQMDARNIPFRDEFDVIGAFDVLEHIEQDETVLQQVHQALNPGGLVLMTVPQHPWLWSQTDERACHVRRYRAGDLHRKFESAGFQVLRSTSFVTLLLPAMVASRLLRGLVPENKSGNASELDISSWLNSVFYALLQAELGLIKRGFDLPAGGSRLVVAQKPVAEAG